MGTPILDLYRKLEYKASMKKERPDMETFAAGIADKEDSPTIHELAKEFPEKTYKELEKYKNADRQDEASQIPLTEAQRDLVEHLEAARGVCITAEMRKDRTPLDKMKRRAQEAEGELSILKGIETNRVKEAQDALANSLEVNESHQKLNGKLQERLTELEEENKKVHAKLDERIDSMRKAGL